MYIHGLAVSVFPLLPFYNFMMSHGWEVGGGEGLRTMEYIRSVSSKSPSISKRQYFVAIICVVLVTLLGWVFNVVLYSVLLSCFR